MTCDNAGTFESIESEAHRFDKAGIFSLEVNGIMAIDFLMWLLNVRRIGDGHVELQGKIVSWGDFIYAAGNLFSRVYCIGYSTES